MRIAEGVTNGSAATTNGDGLINSLSEKAGDEDGAHLTPEEQALLDSIAEALARLARNKRVGLTLRDKAAFIQAWSKGKK